MPPIIGSLSDHPQIHSSHQIRIDFDTITKEKRKQKKKMKDKIQNLSLSIDPKANL